MPLHREAIRSGSLGAPIVFSFLRLPSHRRRTSKPGPTPWRCPMDTTRHLPLPVITLLALLAPVALPRPAVAAPISADVPPFYGLYFEPLATKPTQVVARVAQFTPQGPIAGTFLPGSAPSAMQRKSPEFVA